MTDKKPKSITYRIANTPEDFELAHTLMRNEGAPLDVLGFPTVMCFEGSELIGICGTHTDDGMIIAGPLLLRTDKRRAFTALRLADYYENTMRGLGITSFIFSAEEGSVMKEACDRYMHNMKPYAIEGDRYFYIRKLDDPQQAIISHVAG